MAKAVSLKILKLQYNGDSIGNNILIEIEVAGEKFSSFQTIKPGSAFEYNQEVRQFRGVDGVIKALVNIRVTEKDFLFSDKGEITETIYIDSNTLPQTFEFQVRVKEKNRLTFSKSTAIFTITLDAKEFNPIYPRPQLYKNPPKKDYNRFDTEIAEAVGRWNDEFLNQEYPPNTPLDPSLVKAMIYTESIFGYSKKKRGHVDIMQVGTPGDPALHTLNNDGWIDPRTGQVAKENEWQNGKVQVMDYKGEANNQTFQASLKWGVRWLYHKAQYTENGRRKWFTWDIAVKRYGPGSRKEKDNPNATTKYQRDVLRIYREGISPEGKSLWITALVFLGLIISTHLGLNAYNDFVWQKLQTANVIQTTVLDKLNREYDLKSSRAEYLENRLQKIQEINSNKLKNAIWQTFTREDQEETEDVQAIPYDSSLFATIVEYEKDWWEDINIGRIKDGKIKWLEINEIPHENSILSAEWVKLSGADIPILEVYAKTHMGNGDIYLYKVNGNEATLFFATFAVSGYWSLGDSEDNIKKYGYSECGETYQNGKLFSTYSDLNNDGIFDLTLTGTNVITCYKATAAGGDINATNEDIEVSRSKVKKTYLLNPDNICTPDKYYIYTCK